MAEPIKVVRNFREGVQDVADNMRAIDGLLAIIEDMGADDAARLAFLAGMFGEGTPNSDITQNDFAAGIIALRAMRTAWGTNKYAIAKLLI